MEQAERERLIQDMVGCGRAWEEDTSRPDFSLSVVQRLATLTPEEYEAVWAEFQSREEEDMEAGMQVVDTGDVSPMEQLIRDIVAHNLLPSGFSPGVLDAERLELTVRFNAYSEQVQNHIRSEVLRRLQYLGHPMPLTWELPGTYITTGTWNNRQTDIAADIARVAERAAANTGAEMRYITNVNRPHITLTTETEFLLGRLLNPTTTLERLCVAAMRGDAVAFAVLSDGIQQGELTL